MASPKQEPEESSRLPKWLTILLTGVVSLIVGVGSALILDYVRTSAAKLEYEVISSSTFSGAVQKLAMVAIEVENSGRKELELVAARIQLKGATILETKTEGFPAKGLIESKTNDAFLVELPFLNPHERGRILLLLNLPTGDFVPPTVELRAKGVSGIQRTTERKEKKETAQPIAVATASAFVALNAFALLRVLRGVRDKRRGYSTSHSDDQRDVTAFVLDVSGLSDEAHELRLQTRKLSYWSIADELTQRALTKNDTEHMRKLACAFEALMKYAAVAETSCFLVNYNLARLYVRLGEAEKAKAALDLARKENHKVIEKRIALTDDLKRISPATLEDGPSKIRRNDEQ